MRLSVAALIFLATAAHAQPAPWRLQSPGTTNWQINDVAFVSPDHGFFCANNLELWETTNRGQSWTNRIRYAGFGVDGNQFASVGFLDGQRGFLISNEESPAYFTTNAGQTWQPASGARPWGREFFDVLSPTQAFLGGPQFLTSNAGASWTQRPWPADMGRVFGFDMRDSMVGLMASETYNPPIIAGTYRTTDGGSSWTRIADLGEVLWLNDTTALNARPYLDPNFPYPVERGAAIWRSTDSGVTWDLVGEHVAPGLFDQQQGFWDWCRLDANTVLGVTLSGKVWKSADAGATWTLTQPHDLIRGPVPDTTMGIRAFGGQAWVFAEKGIALRSDDFGDTWSYPASGVGLDVSEIKMRDDLVGLALAGGFVLRTTDGGGHWSPTRLNIEGIDDILPPDRDYIEGYRNISWVSPTTVYIQGGASNCCAGRMVMWKSTDAGETWSFVYGLQQDIRVTHFDCEEMIWTDQNTCFLLGFDTDPFDVGPSGYRSTDGGQTWTWMNSLLQSGIYSADFIDSARGWIQFGQTSTAYTTNAGDSWTVVQLPGSGFNDMDMFSATVGFAAGVLGETYRTTNGGRSWQLLPPLPTTEDYYDIVALSSTEAIMIGRDNTDQTRLRFFVRRTLNGGQTWTRDDLPDEWNTRFLHAYHLDALDAARVWVAGWGGLVGSNAPPAQPCSPDFNADGNVDQDDIACLVATIAGNGACTALDPDFNRDGNVDQDDVIALINVVAGGPCP